MKKNNVKKISINRMFNDFIKAETSGGIILVICTAVAIILANSPLSSFYHHLWETGASVKIGGFSLDKPLHFWINDGLMTIFFFVVGMEIKREMLVGELASLKQSMLPILAALGGMIFPAIIYSVFNLGTTASHGWGIPTATDIAFAIGILSLLGNRVPVSLKVFLTALAIADDLGAVVVIAIFYTGKISLAWLAYTGIICAVLFAINRSGMRNPIIYYAAGIILWITMLNSGIHATIAGVIMAIAIPSTSKIDQKGFIKKIQFFIREFHNADRKDRFEKLNDRQNSAMKEIESAVHHAASPMQRLQEMLHPWVTFFIMPLFALSNAGVELSGKAGEIFTNHVSSGIMLGLILGKPAGITLFSWIAIKLNLASMPRNASWIQLFGIGCLAGIGFTMAIFVANISFAGDEIITVAKLGIFTASILSAVIGYTIITAVHRSGLKKQHD